MAEADRNLLFGILALQMDFIGRDALVEAMHDWLLRKHVPLGQVLVERGALAAAERELLEPLVARHLARHGDDPARSLASLTSVAWIRDALAPAGDAELTATLSHVARPAAGPDAPPARAPAGPGGPRFRILRPHARGGLGEVFVARDAELNRDVALKQIQDRHADHPESRARFVLEAEVTGGLEHPGIVPVYGLGHDAEGRPYYAMRFIKGDSLKEAIELFHRAEGPGRDPGARALELRRLLGRFVDVCNALAYSHSRGVLHRDLKPGNIMLGPYGETLVVDWGLAKPLGRSQEGAADGTLRPSSGSGLEPTQMGSAVGTPAYMSPEQAAGDLDRLGPASDVYSLGATLYSLLTGRAPVEGADLAETLRRVRAGAIPPVRRVNPAAPQALEAVCRKTMALRPEGRYDSPRALAEELERWLADEPVAAYREPLAERARRWAKRRRTAVAATAAALVVGLVGVGGVAAVQTKARRDLGRKNGELTLSNGRVTAANARLVAANAALDAQRRRAEDHEARAIAAVRRFRDAVAEEPELKATRRWPASASGC
jgi:serine/threonine-protein kinase